VELPLFWFGRIQNGVFCYLDDRHLCHMTDVPHSVLYVYDPRTTPHWRNFDPALHFSWTQDFPILLRTAGLCDAQCIGIEHIVRSLHVMPGALDIPDVYRDHETAIGNMSDGGSD
jgi:hypothetical protein